MPRDNVILQCTECKERNYVTTKNKKNTPNRAGIQKVLQSLPLSYFAQRK